ncbi:MAG: thioredoxin family protein [Candidatus Delongbacteria bacterium]|jgi:thioredoxin-related protein|nr:thioredoxin family protein [Candidatus Delongbacteria bacterium]
MGNWETSYSTAIAKAKKSGKKLLLDFTGSDWCGWCVRLDNEVFSKKEFQNYAKDNLILVKLDFPRSIKQSNELKKQNKSLANKFGIKGYPTIILLDNNEKLLGQTGYQKGGAVKYVQHLIGLIGKQ